MAKNPHSDEWLTTTEFLDRGWARKWLEPFLGPPTKGAANTKLWRRDQVLAAA